MEPKFNIDRPKVSDEEINKQKDFDKLVKQFKEQSLKKAREDKSWWKSKKVRYSSVIAGVTVICTISYFALFNNQSKNNTTNETLITQNKNINYPASTKKAFVSPPSTKISVPYSSYKINNSKGGEITHAASKIKVPKNSFVDKNGKDIIGDVTIEYREFQHKADIIAAGIPMAYDSAGTKYNLESAGMFDIKGMKDGEPVFIKKGNELKVELASFTDENRFNQYYLDTVNRNWNYIKKDEAHAVRKAANAASTSDKLSEPASLSRLKNEFEVVIPKKIDSVKVVYTKKVETLPKAKEPAKPAKATGRPTFQLDGSTDEFPELSAFNNVLFEVGPENNNYKKELHDITWSDVKVSEGPQKGKNYLLTLTYRKRVEKLVVYPVLSGADLEKAEKMYQKKFKEYEGLVEKRVEDEKKLIAEMEAKQKAYMEDLRKAKEKYEKERAELVARMKSEQMNELNNNFGNMSNPVRATRIFNVAQFGIFNSDCPRKMPEGESMMPRFAVDNAKAVSPDIIYLVDHTMNSVYNYKVGEFSKIPYNPSNTNSFVVFTKNKMYICNKKEFSKGAKEAGKLFNVTELPESAENISDFRKALDI
jgi:hypothetical protein